MMYWVFGVSGGGSASTIECGLGNGLGSRALSKGLTSKEISCSHGFIFWSLRWGYMWFRHNQFSLFPQTQKHVRRSHGDWFGKASHENFRSATGNRRLQCVKMATGIKEVSSCPLKVAPMHETTTKRRPGSIAGAEMQGTVTSRCNI